MDSNLNKDFKTNAVDIFTAFENKWGKAASAVSNSKETAMAEFIKSGLPTKKNEDWKYTNLAFLNEYSFSAENISNVKNISQFAIPNIDCNTVVFVNGIFDKSLSLISVQNGFDVIDINDVQESKIKTLLNSSANEFKKNIFTDLNTALFNSGVYINAKKNTKVEKPLHIIHINSSESKNDLFTNPRIITELEQGAELSIIESFHSEGENTAFTNRVSEVLVNENAHCEYYMLHNDENDSLYVGNLHIIQKADSLFNSAVINLGGRYVRNNINSRLTAPGCQTHFYGYYYSDKNRTVDNHTFVDHAAPHCESNEIYRGILADKAVGIFNGKILVRPDAQKTNAYQSNKNVLLSDDAVINTKPELEIYADDVKCSHGATSGTLDKDQLFYLLARGISKEKATGLLLKAFGAEAVSKIQIDELREYVQNLIEKKLNIEIE